MLPYKTPITLDGEAVVIVASTYTANDARFFVDGALVVVVVVLSSFVVW